MKWTWQGHEEDFRLHSDDSILLAAVYHNPNAGCWIAVVIRLGSRQFDNPKAAMEWAMERSKRET